MRLLPIACLLLFACREAPPTYLKPVPEFPEKDGAVQLTYNVHDDRAPAMHPTDASVTYTASGYPPFPLRRGLLLSVLRTGGQASFTLPHVQVAGDSTPWLTAPAFSPNGDRIAFVELRGVVDMPSVCSAGLACPFSNSAVILTRAVLHVGGMRDEGDVLQHPITFCCRTRVSHPGGELADLVTAEAHPFQQQFERDSSQIFRPSWSPDGGSLVYSDGLDLYLFDVVTGATTLIPNTRDGVWPAWSPDGSRIAFTRLQRGPAESATCMCLIRTNSAPVPIGEWRIIRYFDGGRRTGTLVLIDRDGGNTRELGIGEAPAWMPSGNEIVAQRQGRLWRIDSNSGAATEIPGTEGGYEPALSRDGRWLVYSRIGSEDRHDIFAQPLN